MIKYSLLQILLFCFFSNSAFASNRITCETTPWSMSRHLSKSEVLPALEKTDRKKLKAMAFYEMNHESRESMGLPLTLYLANTEMDRSERGFWKIMAYIVTQGENPEKVYEKWPAQRGRAKIPLSGRQICSYYNKALSH
jgi:hypothetical protein